MTTESIGARIERARLARGWTQERLAEEVGLGRPAISKIESNKRQVTAIEIVNIAAMLGVKTSALLGDTFQIANAMNATDEYSSTQPEPSRCPACGSRLFKEYGCVYNVATDQGDQVGWHCLMCCSTFETCKVGRQIRCKVTGVRPVTLQPGELKEIRRDSARRTLS